MQMICQQIFRCSATFTHPHQISARGISAYIRAKTKYAAGCMCWLTLDFSDNLEGNSNSIWLDVAIRLDESSSKIT